MKQPRQTATIYLICGIIFTFTGLLRLSSELTGWWMSFVVAVLFFVTSSMYFVRANRMEKGIGPGVQSGEYRGQLQHPRYGQPQQYALPEIYSQPNQYPQPLYGDPGYYPGSPNQYAQPGQPGPYGSPSSDAGYPGPSYQNPPQQTPGTQQPRPPYGAPPQQYQQYPYQNPPY